MTLVPTDALLSPVKGHDDLTAFRFDFTLDGKALEDGTSAPVVTETSDGDLIIEGYAAVFDGLDREGENFTDGAFNRGIKSFLQGQSGLCYHHKHALCLGKVLDLEEKKGKGLWMRARVDSAIQSHPEMKTYYEQIKKGTLNALSVGGFFKRAANKIVDMDFTEISVTPVPVHSGTSFAVVAGKALGASPAGPDDVVEADAADAWLAEVGSAIESIGRVFDRIESAPKSDEKALPDTHDPAAASAVAGLLRHTQRLRSESTVHANYSEHAGVKKLANEIETAVAAHEASLHKLAAKVGPLPDSYYN